MKKTSPKYGAHRAKMAERNRAASLAAREMGELAECANPARRESCRLNFRLFCETYFPKTFTLAWSPDHLRVIAKTETVTLRGGMHAHAMPRGSGKTSLVEVGAIWALLYRHREFVAVVGPEHDHATQRIDNIRTELENNDLLLADFPEVCAPIRRLEGIFQRRLVYRPPGATTPLPIRQEFSADCIAFANLKAPRFAGGRVQATSMTGQIRGMVIKREDGTQIRPSLVLLDDPQKDELARSPLQVDKLERIINGSVMGMGGPDETISALMPCTVICENDLADRYTDPERYPQWRGERTKMVYTFPTNTALWEDYAALPADDLDKRNAFYRRNRKALDEGAAVAWPERHPGCISGIQYAMNLKLDLKDRAFFAEYQNDPLPEYDLDADQLTVDAITSRLSGVTRGVVPLDAQRVTAFIDPKAKLLAWMVVAWGEGFTGSVIDYGTFPDQKSPLFAMRDAKRTLAMKYPGSGLEGTIFRGLQELSTRMLGVDWLDEEGVPRRIDRLLVDANWGSITRTVYSFIRASPFAATILPSHGKGISADMLPLSEYRRRPGERPGLNWRIGIRERRQRGVLFDANFWKSFVKARLQTSEGDPGALTLYGTHGQTTHEMIAQHFTAEYGTPTAGRSRMVEVWKKKRVDLDEDYFDCIVGAAVAASIEGVALASEERVVKRERVSFAGARAGGESMRAAAMAKRASPRRATPRSPALPPPHAPARTPARTPARVVEVPEIAGLECLACGCRHFYVVWTRPRRDKRIVRRRECRNCGRLMTTVERST